MSLAKGEASCLCYHVQGPFLASTNASSLVSLSCRQCQLSGTLPSGSGFLELTMLDLAENALTGTMPGSWQEMKKLVTLDLSGNSITGLDVTNLPASLQRLVIQGGNLTALPVGEVLKKHNQHILTDKK